MKLTVDNWLTSMLGCKVVKVAVSAGDAPTGIKKQLQEVANGKKCFLYTKVPVADVGIVRDLSSVGFSVVDVNVTFERAASRGSAIVGSGVSVCVVRPEHAEAVLDIAQSCFVYSRFHLDTKIDPVVANAIKREWVANYIRGVRGDKIFVALVNDKPVGFLAALLADEPHVPVGVIDLVGVARDCMRHGVGQALIDAFLEDMAGRVTRVIVGTQVANVPSMRLYAKCGFAVSSASYVLHAHIDEVVC